MVRNRKRPAKAKKGLLTPAECAVVLLDLQPLFALGVASINHRLLLDNNILLAKSTRIFDVPIVVSTTESRSFGGQLWPQIQSVVPCVKAVERSAICAWDEQAFIRAVKATERSVLVLAGLWTASSVAFAAIEALRDGYDIYVVEDCCGDVSERAHASGMSRMTQAGARSTTAIALTLEWQHDWAAKGTYDAVMDLVRVHGGASGFGVEYSYTMVHHASPLQPAPYIVPGPADTLT